MILPPSPDFGLLPIPICSRTEIRGDLPFPVGDLLELPWGPLPVAVEVAAVVVITGGTGFAGPMLATSTDGDGTSRT